MYSWNNLVHKFKLHGVPEKRELRDLAITAVIIGFIFSFRDWGVDTFDPVMGIFNFFISVFIVGVALCIGEFTTRYFALVEGYRSQYRLWIIGLVIGLVVTFITNGYWFFLAPGALIINVIPHERMLGTAFKSHGASTSGYHRMGKFGVMNHKHLGWIAMSGPIANMLFAVLLNLMYLASNSALVHKAMVINIWIALFSMIPIPPLNGSKTFFGSPFIYMFVVGTLIGCAALLYYSAGILSIIGGLALGALAVGIFFVFVEKKFQ